MLLILLFVPWIILGLFGGYLVAHKGYSPWIGIIIALVCGPTGLVLAALLPSTQRGRELAELARQTNIELRNSKKYQACPKCGRWNSVTTKVCPRCEFHFS